MTPILIILASLLLKASPSIITAMEPILSSASKSLWKTAWPLALQIVQDVEKSGVAGLQKHADAVALLEKAIVATGKIALGQASKLHLSQIVLAAFASSLATPQELMPVSPLLVPPAAPTPVTGPPPNPPIS